jgi:hypothetical protein
MLMAACVFVSAGTLGCAPQLTPEVAAFRVARDRDLENWKKAQAAGVAVHDGELQELEDRFQAISLSNNEPAGAVKDLTLYRTNKAYPGENEIVGLEDYTESLDSTLLIDSLSSHGYKVVEGSVIPADE